ncbi:Very-long-chain 3-oxoacyl-CoA reductase 1 [Platanthera zijinensis]|uniref:Very-long-chain 3-oxoacyl-CoA reductase 1 n=1 Tax=Platanthera zijinensis TaxID=2320716 RepID=A0AAP0FVI0_9ASPA
MHLFEEKHSKIFRHNYFKICVQYSTAGGLPTIHAIAMEVNFFLLLLSFLGLVSFLKRSFSLLHWLYASFLRHPKDLKRVYGPWAVVTGATDGIGLAMSVQLARRGMHLVIVGRNSGRLKKATEHILARCGADAKVRTVVWDLAEDAGGGGSERLREAIEGVDVGVLLNCAGTTYAGAVYFHEAEEREWREVVKVNVDGTSHVTRVVLPKMVSRRRGAVVNVGSASTVALPSFPLHAIYAATKAFTEYASKTYEHDNCCCFRIAVGFRAWELMCSARRALQCRTMRLTDKSPT